MAYTLEAFCTDVRALLEADPGPSGVEQVRKKMELLVADPGFVAEHFHSGVKYGPRRMFVDPELGFEVLGYRAEKAWCICIFNASETVQPLLFPFL